MITWIQNKTIKLFAILSYPTKLIPKAGFKKEIKTSDLEDLGPIGIVRRSLKSTKAETFDKFGGIREDALVLHKRDVPGLSLNLLGNNFMPPHIAYIPTKEAGREWNGQEKGLWRKYIGWVDFKMPSIPIFFFLADLHNKTFPYYRKNDSEVEKLIKLLNITPPKTASGVELYGASVIKHSPARLNYWHVEFRLLDIESRVKGTPTLIAREKVKSYKDQSIAMDISKQHWINQAASHGLNDILLNSAHDSISKNDFSAIKKNIYLN